MKKNIFKFCTLAFSIVSIFAIPSILTSCSSNKISTPNLNSPYQNFSLDFIKTNKDLKVAPNNVDNLQYQFLHNYIIKKDLSSSTLIEDKLKTIKSGFSSENAAIEYATNLLDNLNLETISKTILINFNKKSFLSKVNTTTQLLAKKSFYTIKTINYDNNTKKLSFVLNYNYTCVDENIIPNYTSNITNLYSTEYSIEFNNFQLIPSTIQINSNYIPIFTINQNYESSSIKYINNNVNINVSEIYNQQLNFIKWSYSNNNIDKEEYNNELSNLNNIISYYNNVLNLSNNVINFNFLSPKYILNSENIHVIPFSSINKISIDNNYNDTSKYILSNFNIGLLEVKYNSNFNNNSYWVDISQSQYGIPIFNFINFYNDSFDIITNQ